MNYLTKNPLCLGLDPGIGNTGWALVRRTATGYQLTDSGVITTASTTPLGKTLGSALRQTSRDIENVYAGYSKHRERLFQPQYLIVYLDGFSYRNCRTRQRTGGHPYTPNQASNGEVRSHRLRHRV